MSGRCNATVMRRVLTIRREDGYETCWITKIGRCERAATKNGKCWQHAAEKPARANDIEKQKHRSVEVD